VISKPDSLSQPNPPRPPYPKSLLSRVTRSSCPAGPKPIADRRTYDNYFEPLLVRAFNIRRHRNIIKNTSERYLRDHAGVAQVRFYTRRLFVVARIALAGLGPMTRSCFCVQP
jgi:hypothetical protein